jgi:hypothetical protein
MIKHMKKKGFTIAVRTGYNQCGEADGHIPDVRGKNNDELNPIEEAKTCAAQDVTRATYQGNSHLQRR